MNVVVCVLFNHPFPSNIPIIKSILEYKFRNIIFVQPFLPSDRDDVVVSYRGSFNFQGMMIDAIPKLSALNFDYVVFIQDDCLLNPIFDENNIIRELGVDENTPYFPKFVPVSGRIDDWYMKIPLLWRLFYNHVPLLGTGVETYSRYLPEMRAARAHVENRYGLTMGPLLKMEPYPFRFGALADPNLDDQFTRLILEGLFKNAPDGAVDLGFPWLHGVSDFCVMSRPSLRKIELFLGVTAAANIFVESAIPTALAVHHDRISTSETSGWHANYLWARDRETVSVESALSAFENRFAVLHPLKLSQQAGMVAEIMRRSPGRA